ncbi:MAG UNVERIFIED_CONTAM: hypothetical protein LVQ98_02650 [Rickettsiaceae bacterium]
MTWNYVENISINIILKNIPDALYNLNELTSKCTNLKWASPVVCWFADNIDAGNANIFPAIEYNDSLTSTSEKWQVEDFRRENAETNISE